MRFFFFKSLGSIFIYDLHSVPALPGTGVVEAKHDRLKRKYLPKKVTFYFLMQLYILKVQFINTQEGK